MVLLLVMLVHLQTIILIVFLPLNDIELDVLLLICALMDLEEGASGLPGLELAVHVRGRMISLRSRVHKESYVLPQTRILHLLFHRFQRLQELFVGNLLLNIDSAFDDPIIDVDVFEVVGVGLDFWH